MYTKLLKKAPIILLALNFIACSVFTPAVPAPDAADVEREEQAVYSFFVGGNNNGAVLILQETSTGISDTDPAQSADYLKSDMKGISRDTMNSYLARNAQPGQLSADMQLGVEYSLITTDQLSEITSQSNWGDILVETYGAHGYTIFSRVGFNNSLDQAVVYVGSVMGPMMGSGSYFLLEKKDGAWVIKEELMSWIS